MEKERERLELRGEKLFKLERSFRDGHTLIGLFL